MGKWLAGILASVIAALAVWYVVGLLEGTDDPSLQVTAWNAPTEVEIGRTMEVFVKVLDEDDAPVVGADVQLTPTSGTFLWAGAGTDPIRGTTDANGQFMMTFQTVVQVGLIGDEELPSNSSTGTISVLVSKAGYADGRTELAVNARS